MVHKESIEGVDPVHKGTKLDGISFVGYSRSNSFVQIHQRFQVLIPPVASNSSLEKYGPSGLSTADAVTSSSPLLCMSTCEAVACNILA